MRKAPLRGKQVSTAAIAAMLVCGVVGPAAAELPDTVYAAAYLGADEVSETSLPATVSDGTVDHAVTWDVDAESFAVPYETVESQGTADGRSIADSTGAGGVADSTKVGPAWPIR